MATATVDFSMHPDLLRSVIKKQAGSLSKAILEGTMNSIDADATRIDIVIEPMKITITDDGCGFRNADEIRDFFATFGTPHQDGDATYGRFRMGRGQMFAYGRNTWRTGEFQMDVDIDKHLGFELKENLVEVPGCAITINLYDPLAQSDIHSLTRELVRMVKYAPVSIYINDECINVDINLKQFPQTTDDAYIKTESNSYGALEIYNLGIFVCSLPAWQYGISGVVVSRKQLDVNFARNQVLGTCKVWKRIKEIVDQSGRKAAKQQTLLTPDGQANVIARLLSGDMTYREVENVRFLQDVTGKAWSPKQIRLKHFEAYTVAEMNNSFGDKLMQQGTALVLSAEWIAQFECAPEKLFEIFPWTDMPLYVDMQTLTKDLNAIGVPLDKKTWKPTEKAWIVAITHMVTSYRAQTRQWTCVRRIGIGTSHVAHAWTDGKTFITFAREFLAPLKMLRSGAPNAQAITTVALVLMHELCHDTDSRENIHSPDFYREFHDKTMSYVPELVKDTMRWMTPARYRKIVGGLEVNDDDASHV